MHATKGRHADRTTRAQGPAVSALVATEHADPRFSGLDSWDDAAILSALLDGQKRGLDAVSAALSDIATAAQLGVAALQAGGRLIYVGAGSPGLIALGDALEIPQTYGIARDRIEIVRAAKTAGAGTVGIAGNGGAPLLADADVAILLASGAEVISGSTRMAAGTAQKAALNMLSTLIGVRMGHVHDNFMVNVTADNDKLVLRATGIVARIAGVGPDVAAKAMQTAHNEVKPAILLAAGAKDLSEAQQLLAQSGGVVRKALAVLGRP